MGVVSEGGEHRAVIRNGTRSICVGSYVVGGFTTNLGH